MSENRQCSVNDCDRPVHAKGLCSTHYQRLWKHGDPLAGVPARTARGKPLEFFENVVLSYDGDDCLIWPFYRNSAGYAKMRYEGRVQFVSRLVCERVHGPAPTAEHHAAHSCGKGHLGCVNRQHLYWATPTENQADRFVHGTLACGERHGCAKLTEADVRTIRELIGTMPQSAIAKKFNVTQSRITSIKTGRTWRHIGDLAKKVTAKADVRRTT